MSQRNLLPLFDACRKRPDIPVEVDLCIDDDEDLNNYVRELPESPSLLPAKRSKKAVEIIDLTTDDSTPRKPAVKEVPGSSSWKVEQEDSLDRLITDALDSPICPPTVRREPTFLQRKDFTFHSAITDTPKAPTKDYPRLPRFKDVVVPENCVHLGMDNYVWVNEFSMFVHVKTCVRGRDGILRPKNGVVFAPSRWLELQKTDAEPPFNVGTTHMFSTDRDGMVRVQRMYERGGTGLQLSCEVFAMPKSVFKALRSKETRLNVTGLVKKQLLGAAFRKAVMEVIRAVDQSPLFVQHEAEERMISVLTSTLKSAIEKRMMALLNCGGCQMNYENQMGHICLDLPRDFIVQQYFERALHYLDPREIGKDFATECTVFAANLSPRFLAALNAEELFGDVVTSFVSETM